MYEETMFTIKLPTQPANYIATTRKKGILGGLLLLRRLHTIADMQNAQDGQKETPTTISSLN